MLSWLHNMEVEPKMIYEMPRILTEDNVVYYSEHYKALEAEDNGSSRQSKAKKFLKEKCIAWDPEHSCWLCKPILGYNNTTYHIKDDKHGSFECSCQFNQKTGKICSHILALYLFLKIKNYNNKSVYEEEENRF